MYAHDSFKKEAIKSLEKATGRKIDENELSVPPNPALGDLSTTIAFTIAKETSGNPKEVAEKIASKIKPSKMVSAVKTAGPYINFFIDYSKFSEKTLKDALKKNYGSQKTGKGKKVMVEFCGVNPNKPHHIGHFRNESLGQAVSNVYSYLGYDVITATIINDKGVPVAKTMLGYQMWGDGKTPKQEKMKPDHYAGKWYSMLEAELEKKPELEQKVKELVQKIQSNDMETQGQWKQVWDWFFEGMSETHKREGVRIDKFYLESEIQSKGKQIIQKGLEKGIFKIENGAVVAKLEQYGLPDKVLQRSDSTAVYATTDIGMAAARFEEHPDLTRNIYCVMNEQITYFQQWMKSFELLYPQHAGKSYHLAYGMVKTKEGEKMSSRKGEAILADDFMDELTKNAAETAKKNNPEMAEKMIKKISETVGLGALKFTILSTESKKDIHFDMQKALSFEGDTGPYLQYAHARCNQIIEKAGQETQPDYALLTSAHEKGLIRKISEFPQVVEKAGSKFEVHSIAQYLLELAHAYSSFYENCPVMKAETAELKATRLQLVKAAKNTLRVGLNLLGIEAPEKM